MSEDNNNSSDKMTSILLVAGMILAVVGLFVADSFFK